MLFIPFNSYWRESVESTEFKELLAVILDSKVLTLVDNDLNSSSISIPNMTLVFVEGPEAKFNDRVLKCFISFFKHFNSSAIPTVINSIDLDVLSFDD